MTRKGTNVTPDAEETTCPGSVDGDRATTSHPPTEVGASQLGAQSPVTSLDDPRALQILSAEHSSLVSARSLAFNETLTRGGMFLTFLSMSFVALALVAQATSLGSDFQTIALVVLGFDFLLGLTTIGRIVGANNDDFRAIQGMARIRHGYTQIAPILAPYFVTGTHDDVPGVMLTYGTPPEHPVKGMLYGLTTSLGMMSLIVALIGGVIALVIALVLGTSGALGFGIAAPAGLAVFAGIWIVIPRHFANFNQAQRYESRFPTPQTEG